jgi:hypothetical protein
VRVNVPAAGPYLSVSLAVENTPQGKDAKGKIGVINGGTEPLEALQATIQLSDNSGKTIAMLPLLTVEPLPLREQKEYPFLLPTAALLSGIYRAAVDIPYNGKNAHAEAEFKIGEKRVSINRLIATPAQRGGIAKFLLETESFWSEPIPVRIDLRILKGNNEIGAVRDQLEEVGPWQQRTTALFWETGDAPLGTYDVEVVLRYAGKEERKTFPAAVTIGALAAPPAKAAPWRVPALIIIGVLIILLVAAMIFVLRKRKHAKQKG